MIPNFGGTEKYNNYDQAYWQFSSWTFNVNARISATLTGALAIWLQNLVSTVQCNTINYLQLFIFIDALRGFSVLSVFLSYFKFKK